MKNLRLIAGISALLILLLALAGATLVFAQDSEPPEESVPESGETAPGFGFGRFGRHGPWGAFMCREVTAGFPDPEAMKEAVADALGISVEALESARAEGQSIPDLAEELGVDLDQVRESVQAVHEAAIDQALADGLITEEQAEQLKNRLEDGGIGPRGFGLKGFTCLRPTFGGPARPAAMQEALAGALGISVEELEAARAEGKTLPALAEELGVDLEDVRAALEEARAEVLAQAVEAGIITQEQADRMQNRAGGRMGTPGLRPFGGGRGPFFAPDSASQ